MNSDPEIANGTPIRQFSIMLENRVGALSNLVNLLRESMVEVLGLSLVDSVDVTIARMIFSDPEIAAQRFMECGVPHSCCQLVVVELAEGATGLGHCLNVLLQAETNIHFSYGLLVQYNEHPCLALHLEDAEFGISVLHRHGFRTLCEEDLSR